MLLRPAVLVAAALHRPTPCLPIVRMLSDEARVSVSGVVYAAPADKPTIKLFTKDGCTLCDVAKDVLAMAAAQRPHTLEKVDITDPENSAWWDKYKYDIPVLHVGDAYWTKHRVTLDEVEAALAEAASGAFEARKGEPNAKELLGY